jgi:hypothetical protein
MWGFNANVMHPGWLIQGEAAAVNKLPNYHSPFTATHARNCSLGLLMGTPEQKKRNLHD